MGRTAITTNIFVITLVCSALNIASAQQAQPESIDWQDDAEAAVQMAKNDKRPLLVYVTAADCLHCRTMEKRTWRNAAVVRAVEENYVPLRLTAEKHGKSIRQLNVQAFPTTILLTSQIKIHNAAVGMLSPDELSQLLSRGPATVAQQPVPRQ